MTVKQAALEIAAELPEDCTWEEFRYRVYVREKLEESLAAADRGELVPHDEASRMIDQWLQEE